MKITFCQLGKDPDEKPLCQVEWNIIPRSGDFVGIVGKSWVVAEVWFSAYVDGNSDTILSGEPCITIYLKKLKQ